MFRRRKVIDFRNTNARDFGPGRKNVIPPAPGGFARLAGASQPKGRRGADGTGHGLAWIIPGCKSAGGEPVRETGKPGGGLSPGCLSCYETILSPTTEAMSVVMKNRRGSDAGSWKTMMPSSTVPSAPIPVHTG